jgi:ATP-dependent Lon protease
LATLFGPYLKGATKVVITDPDIRLLYQARNLMELLETIIKQKPDEDEVEVHLVTTEDDFKAPQQMEYLEKMQDSCATVGLRFSWEFDESSTVNARHIITDHGWKILLNQGLDVFGPYEMNDTFAISNRMPRYRPCKAFEVTYVRVDDSYSEPRLN